MVVLQEGDYPIQAGFTAAESAVRGFCSSYTGQYLLLPPELAVHPWEIAPGCTHYVHPELASQAPGLPSRILTLRPSQPWTSDEELVAIWSTAETARSTRLVRTEEDADTIRLCTENDLITLSVGEKIRVISNQPLVSAVSPTRVSLDPSWEDLHRPSLYPEEDGHQVYYVLVDRPDDSVVSYQFPELPEEACQDLGAYRETLHDRARGWFDERWGRCGVCYETVDQACVYGCCQYVICSSCDRSLEPHRCPACRIENPESTLVGPNSSPAPRQPRDVCQAIIQASPGARVLYVEPGEGGQVPTVSLMTSTGGRLHAEQLRLPTEWRATHVVHWGPSHPEPDPVFSVKTGCPDHPLQVYYVGFPGQSAFRAAAALGRLEDLDNLPVVHIVYRQTPTEVLRRAIEGWGLTERLRAESLLLHYTVIHHRQGFPDWDLQEVELFFSEEHQRRRISQSLSSTHRPGATWTWRVGDEERVSDDNLHLRLDDRHELNLTQLWCQLDPERRSWVPCPPSDPVGPPEDNPWPHRPVVGWNEDSDGDHDLYSYAVDGSWD